MKSRDFPFCFVLASAILLGSTRGPSPDALPLDRPKQIRAEEFRSLMQTVSEGWNEADARKSADCFAAGAIYSEPPDKQLYAGRQARYDFFGGDKKPDPPMQMTGHHPALRKPSRSVSASIHSK
jgi:hypothetical protein